MSERSVCLVSGSSSGIGEATVRNFARNGYNVVINYNSGRDKAELIAEQIQTKYDVTALCVGADLSQRDEPFRLVDKTISHFGRLDVVISNSGVVNYLKDEHDQLQRFRFHECPPEHLDGEMERVLDLNLIGAYRLAQRALSYMIETAASERTLEQNPSHRSILFITSISDVAPESTRIPYGVSKAALNHAVLGAALEGGKYNITVNALRPGVIDTPLTRRPSGLFDPDSGKEFTVADTYDLMAQGGAQVIPRIGTSEDVAEAAYAFVHMPFMTGQLIAIDGGLTLPSAFANRELFLNEGLKKRQKSV